MKMYGALIALSTLFWVGSAHGAFVKNYGTLNGSTVDYVDITESNDGASALFGAPAVTNDTMDFDPIGFSASSAGTQSVDGQLNFTVVSKTSTPISKLVLDEAGDFTLAGLGAASAQATVGTAVKVKVTEVNGIPQIVDGGTLNMVFTPNANGQFNLPADAGTAVPWTGHLSIDINAIAPGATKVEIALDNVLTALSANGGLARIAKKDFSGLIINLPEPASGSLVMAFVMAGGLLRRRMMAA